jgi:hypothetical protein
MRLVRQPQLPGKKISMTYRQNHPRKVCALVAAAVIFPLLAHAQVTTATRPKPVPVVPEANAGWALIPFMGAVLLFSSRRLFGGRANKDK